MLSWLTQVKARVHARACWIEAGCIPSLSEELFRDIYTDASEEQLATLLRLTERYCVVYQTLSRPAKIDVEYRLASG